MINMIKNFTEILFAISVMAILSTVSFTYNTYESYAQKTNEDKPSLLVPTTPKDNEKESKDDGKSDTTSSKPSLLVPIQEEEMTSNQTLLKLDDLSKQKTLASDTMDKIRADEKNTPTSKPSLTTSTSGAVDMVETNATFEEQIPYNPKQQGLKPPSSFVEQMKEQQRQQQLEAEANEIRHLRIFVDYVKVNFDQDPHGTGEWYLTGVVNGVPYVTVDGKQYIDTPGGAMYDVDNGQIVRFDNLYVDVDVDPKDPLSQLRFDTFGLETDGFGHQYVPHVPEELKEAAGDNSWVQYADGILSAIDEIGNIYDAFDDDDSLGEVSKIYKLDLEAPYGERNFGLGNHVYYSNKEDSGTVCLEDNPDPENIPLSELCNYMGYMVLVTDPIYELGIRITDRLHECEPLTSYDYQLGQCIGVEIE